MVKQLQFAAVDTETTGLFPARHDRIIEIAVVRFDNAGMIVDEFATLVNPDRDIGPTHIHGIRPRDVVHAPRFANIAGDIVSRLADAVFVAHNVHFDMGFLRAEFKRLGHDLPAFPYMCTMHLATQVDPMVPSRKLVAVCRHFGLCVERAHSALSDARAVAALVPLYISRMRRNRKSGFTELGISSRSAHRLSWPALPCTGECCRREESREAPIEEPTYLSRLIAKLPSANDLTTETQAYLDLLDRVLEDRCVTEAEAEALLALAEEYGIVREQAASIHQRYVRDLIRVALTDGVLTSEESADLQKVRKLLGMSLDEYERLLSEFDGGSKTMVSTIGASLPERTTLRGKTVCFTGTFMGMIGGRLVEREDVEELATEAGMVVKNGVVKALDYLVAADTDSMSGKAKKARQYGITILSERDFWRALGRKVEGST